MRPNRRPVIFARTGEITPPTMLQTLGRMIRWGGWVVWSEAKNQFPVLLMPFDLLHQRTNNLPTCQPTRFSKPFLPLGSNRLYLAKDETKFVSQARLILDLSHLLFHLLDAFPHACDARLKLGFVDHSFSITVNQAGNPLSKPSETGLKLSEFRRMSFGKQALAIFLFQSRR